MGMVTGGNFAIYDSAAAAQRVVLDSSGNLGLGVTPSAWASGIKAIDVGASSAFFNPGSAAQTWIYNNAYENSGAKYKNTAGGAAWYQMVEGQHAWYTAPSGTAGDAISFSQVMTLDANGNLGIGTSSPASKLSVVAASSNFGGGAAGAQLTVGEASQSTGKQLLLGCNTTSNNGFVQSIHWGTGFTSLLLQPLGGNVIQTVPTTPPTLDTNGQMVFNLTSNTNLRVSVRGSDGVTRTANITLA
jgi:hypothetical protein